MMMMMMMSHCRPMRTRPTTITITMLPFLYVKNTERIYRRDDSVKEKLADWEEGEICCSSSMEIGWPSNVRHVAHVTFDRFNGFIGLPTEFEPEVPRRVPSASASVFGVSTESMQCSYDSRGNSVPTILLLMQRHLYARGGLQAEGIFRINAENSQEDYVRDQLNRGIVPNGIDVHCLAGLLKAWFRELPSGLLDSLPTEQVMQCQSEEECVELMRMLPPTEASLLHWAINLMADVVQEEHQNKMNARNVATVFAPNMTQMADPLTALMYAVKVMNFLKTLIMKALKEREESSMDSAPASCVDPSDENDRRGKEATHDKEEAENICTAKEPISESPQATEQISTTSCGAQSRVGKGPLANNRSCKVQSQSEISTNKPETCTAKVRTNTRKIKTTTQSSKSNMCTGPRKISSQAAVKAAGPTEKSRDVSIVSRLNSRTERSEAWR